MPIKSATMLRKRCGEWAEREQKNVFILFGKRYRGFLSSVYNKFSRISSRRQRGIYWNTRAKFLQDSFQNNFFLISRRFLYSFFLFATTWQYWKLFPNRKQNDLSQKIMKMKLWKNHLLRNLSCELQNQMKTAVFWKFQNDFDFKLQNSKENQ